MLCNLEDANLSVGFAPSGGSISNKGFLTGLGTDETGLTWDIGESYKSAVQSSDSVKGWGSGACLTTGLPVKASTSTGSPPSVGVGFKGV